MPPTASLNLAERNSKPKIAAAHAIIDADKVFFVGLAPGRPVPSLKTIEDIDVFACGFARPRLMT
jgi:hypothetical protein